MLRDRKASCSLSVRYERERSSGRIHLHRHSRYSQKLDNDKIHAFQNAYFCIVRTLYTICIF